MAGTWTHIACTDDGTSAVAYVGGVPVASTSVAGDLPASTAGRVHIGENAPGGDDQYLGWIDELRVLTVALDSAGVAQSASRGGHARAVKNVIH